MNVFYLDASALAKRYVPENGSLLVDEILDKVAGDRIYLLNVGAGEVVSILVRKRNAGVITDAYFRQALVDFETEIVRAADVNKLPIGNRLATSSLSLVVAHSINSTDAVTLKSALAIAQKLRTGGDDLVLIASDLRLLRAAQAEGAEDIQSGVPGPRRLGRARGTLGEASARRAHRRPGAPDGWPFAHY